MKLEVKTATEIRLETMPSRVANLWLTKKRWVSLSSLRKWAKEEIAECQLDDSKADVVVCKICEKFNELLLELKEK